MRKRNKHREIAAFSRVALKQKQSLVAFGLQYKENIEKLQNRNEMSTKKNAVLEVKCRKIRSNIAKSTHLTQYASGTENDALLQVAETQKRLGTTKQGAEAALKSVSNAAEYMKVPVCSVNGSKNHTKAAEGSVYAANFAREEFLCVHWSDVDGEGCVENADKRSMVLAKQYIK